MPCPLSFLAALGLTLSSAPAPKGYLTPQACFLAYMTAVDNNDHAATVACLTDDAVAVRNAYLLYLAAFAISAKRDPMGELQTLLEKHTGAAPPVESWIKRMNDIQNILSRSSRTAKDWENYNRATKALSASLKDQRRFAVDVMALLHNKRPRNSNPAFKVSKVQRDGQYAALTVDLVADINQTVWTIRCVKGNEGWKMMALPIGAKLAPPFPPE